MTNGPGANLTLLQDDPPPVARAQVRCVTDTSVLLERMDVYRADVVMFAQECLWTTRPDGVGIEPLRLEPHQVTWLRQSTKRHGGHFVYKVIVASWPKREGKSMLVSVLLAWRMCCFADQESVVLANSERQAASNIFDELVDFFRNSPALKAYVSEDDIQRRQLNVWRLGNTTTCVPCNFRTVQGMAVTGILAVDELHAVQDMRAYNYLRAQTEATDSQTAISSQAGPSVSSNPVWRLYEQRDQAHIHFDYQQLHMCAWAKRLAEQQKSELTPAEYAALHENAWGGLGEKLFAAELLAAARMPYQQPETAEEWDALRTAWGWADVPYVIGVGLDRAGVSRRGDRSVWGVVGRFDVPDAEPQ